MRVFMVTSGSYSDFHVDAIFSTQEKAEEYVKWSGGEEIDEMELDEPFDKYISVTIDKIGTSNWNKTVGKGKMSFSGERDSFHILCGTRVVYRMDSGGFFCPKCSKYVGYNNIDISRLVDKNKAKLNITVKTDDPIRAVKVANEKRAQLIATNMWGDEDYLEGLQK